MLKNFFDVALPMSIMIAIMVGVMAVNAMFWAGVL
jgi:hypothetical protein